MRLRLRVPGSKLFAASVGAVLCVSAFHSAPAQADAAFDLELKDTGKREYYCTATFELKARQAAPFQDVNGFFYVFVDDKQVGRSKGASFLFPDGTQSASAVFETPNAPCPDVNGYRFVIGACMKDGGFADTGDCASVIAPVEPVQEVTAR